MKRSAALITVVALGIWFALRTASSTRPLLAPADFTAGGPDALEFCDPRNPRFLAVVDRQSAVVMTAEAPDRIGLKTAGGKPIGPRDLEDGVLRIFAVDSGVRAFASGAASPSAVAGEWKFPLERATRFFADFTPRATGREMYATAARPTSNDAGAATAEDAEISLSTLPARVFARQPVEVLVQGTDSIGQAELTAFDAHSGGPTGFFVSSPERVDQRVVKFNLTFPDAGQYVLWGQVGVGAAARFRRFEVVVAP